MKTSFSSRSARRMMTIALLCAVVVFWLAASQITTKGMTGWERHVFDAIYNLPTSLKPYFLGITQAGSVLMVVLVCGVLLLTRHRLQAIRVLLLSAVTFAVVLIAKHFFARPRPNLLLSYVTQRGPHEADYGFPSAHAAIAMAIGIVLLPLLPRKAWWLVFTAVLLVGASRVYLGVHAPLDIIGGFAVGAITSLGYLLILATRQAKPQKRKAKSTPKRRKNKTT